MIKTTFLLSHIFQFSLIYSGKLGRWLTSGFILHFAHSLFSAGHIFPPQECLPSSEVFLELLKYTFLVNNEVHHTLTCIRVIQI